MRVLGRGCGFLPVHGGERRSRRGAGLHPRFPLHRLQRCRHRQHRGREELGESQALSGSLQSLCWGSVAIGGIASSYFSGSLIETYGTKYVFGVSAAFPLLIACAALLVREDPVDEPKSRTLSQAETAG